MRAELKRAADLVAFQRREALSRKRLSGDPRNPFRPRYGAELTFAAASQEAETLGYKVSGEFEVSKVVSSTSENGFIRTKIYF